MLRRHALMSICCSVNATVTAWGHAAVGRAATSATATSATALAPLHAVVAPTRRSSCRSMCSTPVLNGSHAHGSRQTAFRTHLCGDIQGDHVGSQVKLCGWAQVSGNAQSSSSTNRDMTDNTHVLCVAQHVRPVHPVSFIVLRDVSGTVQLAIGAETQGLGGAGMSALGQVVAQLSTESIVAIQGTVCCLLLPLLLLLSSTPL